ncbi:hypothetical protein ACQ86N_43675 [Puia sp. P3]|uniref:hypothetical protein n=1 Tax=Puia sp. P3 TaxID=3423952 RepID=UPI003D667898
MELAWVGDFNKKMLALHEATGARKEKVHRTYLYSFPPRNADSMAQQNRPGRPEQYANSGDGINTLVP